ncbi:MAG: hypothetical protein HC840_01320 [Leptolyngbyaceae cyanobacterium RM2_2_4]|nr:hypothetical protein [Leptolyngbyaceae cyanobacterium RM2_2_4]
MRSIKEILMERDGMSAEEADALIADVTEQVLSLIECGNFEEAENEFISSFGLEPDYMEGIF